MFFSLVVTVSSQGNNPVGMVCGDNECTTETTALNPQNPLYAYLICNQYSSQEYSYRQCNYSASSITSYLSCAQKEESGSFCSQIINSVSEIPLACDSNETCTSDCRAALQAKYGCCLNLDFTLLRSSLALHINPELMKLWELCAFNISNSCQLAIPQLPETVPTTQCNDRDTKLFEGICDWNVNYTRMLFSRAVNSPCFYTRLVYGLLSTYLYCEYNNVGYCS